MHTGQGLPTCGVRQALATTHASHQHNHLSINVIDPSMPGPCYSGEVPSALCNQGTLLVSTEGPQNDPGGRGRGQCQEG